MNSHVTVPSVLLTLLELNPKLLFFIFSSGVQSVSFWQQLEVFHSSVLRCDHRDISLRQKLLLFGLGPAALHDPYRRHVQGLSLEGIYTQQDAPRL